MQVTADILPMCVLFNSGGRNHLTATCTIICDRTFKIHRFSAFTHIVGFDILFLSICYVKCIRMYLTDSDESVGNCFCFWYSLVLYETS